MFNWIIDRAMKKKGDYFALELLDPLELLGGFGTSPMLGGKAYELEEGDQLTEDKHLAERLQLQS